MRGAAALLKTSPKIMAPKPPVDKKQKKERKPRIKPSPEAKFDSRMKKKVAGKRPSSAYQTWIQQNKDRILSKCKPDKDGRVGLPQRSQKASEMWRAFKGDETSPAYLKYIEKFKAQKKISDEQTKERLAKFESKVLGRLRLADGWKEAVNEANGRTYYYSRSMDGKHNVSQYERPYVRSELLAALKDYLKESE